MGLDSLEACVDDLLDVPTNTPAPVSLVPGVRARRQVTWDQHDYIDLPDGRITRSQMENESRAARVDRLITATQLDVRPATRTAVIDHLNDPDVHRWQRLDALMLLLLAAEMHVA